MGRENDRPVRLRAFVAEVTPKTRWIFVEVTAESGRSGWGEATLNNRGRAVLDALRACAPSLSARLDIAPARWTKPASLPEAAALSAIDHALWDLSAQRDGVSVAAALGGERRQSIPLYANINRRTADRSPGGFAASARDAVAAGFEAVKIAPFDEVSPPPAPRMAGALAPGMARVTAVRAAIGPGRDLLVDCHWRFDAAEAEQVIREGEALGLYWVECPLPETEETIPALRRLRGLANERGIRLAGLEMAIGLDGFEPYLRGGTYDAMMPDVKYVGGLGEMMRIAERFAAAGVAFSPHNPTGPICHAVSLQVCAAVSAMDRLETQFDETPTFDKLVGGAVPASEAGTSRLPGGPGLGMAPVRGRVDELSVATLDLTLAP